jgi:hypothetical protein
MAGANEAFYATNFGCPEDVGKLIDQNPVSISIPVPV